MYISRIFRASLVTKNWSFKLEMTHVETVILKQVKDIFWFFIRTMLWYRYSTISSYD